MKKALLPLMVASLVPAAAFADVTVYGKANVVWQNSDLNNGGTFTELVTNASRVGLKGTESIDDDLKAIYQFEYETYPDNGANSSGQTFGQRNIFVGLQGSGGKIIGGMFDTPLKLAQENIDLFNDYVGDLKGVLQGETRATNVVQYSTPAFNNITGTIAYVNAETSVKNTDNGYSASIAYDTKTLYLALANDHNVTNAMKKTVFTKDTDILRAVARYTVGAVQLGGMYETYDNGTSTENGYLVSAQWNVDANWALKVQRGESDMIVVGGTTTSLGADYKLSKSTKVFGYYTKVTDDNTDSTKKRDDQYVGVGVELKF